MFTLYFGTTDKKRNSTKQPDYSSWVKIDNLVWKRPYNIDNPSVFIEYNADNLNWNYAFSPDTNTYYWITSITSERNNLWTIVLKNDVLATYKSAIKNTPCYILYGFNTRETAESKKVIDGRQTIRNRPVPLKKDLFKLLDGHWSETGTYLLSAIGETGAETWAITKDTLKSLNDQLNHNADESAVNTLNNYGLTVQAETISGYSTSRSIFLDSALSAIKSCVYVPISLTLYIEEGFPIGDIVLGEYKTGLTGYRVSGKNWTNGETRSFPWQYSTWKQLFEKPIIHIPFFGQIAVPVDKTNGFKTYSVYQSYSFLTGEYSIAIVMGEMSGDYYPLYSGSVNLGCEVAIGSSNITKTQIIAGTTSLIGGMMDLTSAGMSVVSGTEAFNLASGITDSLDNFNMRGVGMSSLSSGMTSGTYGVSQIGDAITTLLTPTIQMSGGIGGNTAWGLGTTGAVLNVAFVPVDENNFAATYGRPIFLVSTPVDGYCKTLDFPSDINTARINEKMEIASKMDAGVFIE